MPFLAENIFVSRIPFGNQSVKLEIDSAEQFRLESFDHEAVERRVAGRNKFSNI